MSQVREVLGGAREEDVSPVFEFVPYLIVGILLAVLVWDRRNNDQP